MPAQPQLITQTKLHFNDGRSDKVYEANIAEEDGGFIVSFAYGRRGSTLTHGIKTPAPVGKDVAMKVFEKLIKSKVKKGYQVSGEEGSGLAATIVTKEKSGVALQLLNPIDTADVEAYLNNPCFVAQEKHDGQRRATEKVSNEIKGINKKNEYVTMNPVIHKALSKHNMDFILDAEEVGDTLKVFDILSLNGKDVRSLSLSKRLTLLQTLGIFNHMIQLVETSFSTNAKRALLAKVTKNKGEGIVFKEVNAVYEGGRPNSGGTQLKHKLYATATCRVTAENIGKRSVQIDMIDGEQAIPVGNVTIPVNKAIPCAGAFIEVRYLYAYEGGSLYQPTFIWERSDADLSDCHVSQLKFKA